MPLVTNASHPIIRTHYGTCLGEIEETLWRIIDRYFLDRDGFIYAYINSNTLAPFDDNDAEVNSKPIHENWIANGSFPYDLKRTYITYEDSGMAAGDFLMALMSRHAATGDVETATRAHSFFQAMVKLYDTVSRRNPYGAGFLPKPYGGIARAHESFETSADQYFKFTVAVEKYGLWTTDPVERAKASEIILSFARWLDDRDFVTPYMGNPNYGRLSNLMHYLGFFAYIMALGYKLSSNRHYAAEAIFFMERMVEAGKLSTSPNSMNLVVEILDRLLELMPEQKDCWLELMAREWDNRHTYVNAEGIANLSGYTWNFGTRVASTFNTITRRLPDRGNDLELAALLLQQVDIGHFIHQIAADDPNDTTFCEHAHSVVAQSYACWLRAYWESELFRDLDKRGVSPSSTLI